MDSERQALADSLLAVSESYAHDLRVPFSKAGEALHAVVCCRAVLHLGNPEISG